MCRATPSPRFVIVSSYETKSPTATCSGLVGRRIASMRALPAGGGEKVLGGGAAELGGGACGAVCGGDGGAAIGAAGGGAIGIGGGTWGALGNAGSAGTPAALQVIAAALRPSSTCGNAFGPIDWGQMSVMATFVTPPPAPLGLTSTLARP